MQIIVETYNNGSPTPEFNNAGQIFNHDFYWESLSPEKRESPQPQGFSKHSMMSLTAVWLSPPLCAALEGLLVILSSITAESRQYDCHPEAS